MFSHLSLVLGDPNSPLIAVWNFLSRTRGHRETLKAQSFANNKKFSSLVQSWIKWIGSSNCEMTHPKYTARKSSISTGQQPPFSTGRLTVPLDRYY